MYGLTACARKDVVDIFIVTYTIKFFNGYFSVFVWLLSLCFGKPPLFPFHVVFLTTEIRISAGGDWESEFSKVVRIILMHSKRSGNLIREVGKGLMRDQSKSCFGLLELRLRKYALYTRVTDLERMNLGLPPTIFFTHGERLPTLIKPRRDKEIQEIWRQFLWTSP